MRYLVKAMKLTSVIVLGVEMVIVKVLLVLECFVKVYIKKIRMENSTSFEILSSLSLQPQRTVQMVT